MELVIRIKSIPETAPEKSEMMSIAVPLSAAGFSFFSTAIKHNKKYLKIILEIISRKCYNKKSF